MQHASDCAVHNAPALDPGACTCGTAHGPRVTRFNVSAQLIADMLIPDSRLSVKSARAVNDYGFGDAIAFEVEHECVDIPAGFVSVSFRQVTAIGGARVSIFHAADAVAEPTYQRAPYETPKLEAAYKARELLELFKACTPEERASVLDYLDADPRPASLTGDGSGVALPPIEPAALTEEQAAAIKAFVEDGIAYARRFFGEGSYCGNGGSVCGNDSGTRGVMGENGPEAIVPTLLGRDTPPPDVEVSVLEQFVLADGRVVLGIVKPEPGRVTVTVRDDAAAIDANAATEACAHRFVRTGFDPDGPLVVCADCGEPIKRMGVVVTGTAGDPIDAAAVSRAIAKSG